MRRMAVAITACVVLAACGKSNSTSAPTPTTKSTTTTEATTTTGEPTTTTSPESAIRQYVSQLNPQLVELPEIKDRMYECLPIQPLPSCEFTHPVTIMSAGLVAKTITIKLQTLQRDIGEPPAELADLVGRTKRYAAALESGSDAWRGCTFPEQGDCLAKTGAVNSPLGLMVGLVDEWSVYGAG